MLFCRERTAEEVEYGRGGAGRCIRDRAKRIAPVARYRRCRLGESMAERRPGFRVTIELDGPIEGPVSLGALNHFGFGLFRAG